MNEALGRDVLGYIARQTKATQDFRQAIYLYPDGKIGHWVRNPYSEQAYWVADMTGGSTFEPGSTVMLGSFSGRRGEGIIGRSPAGFGGSAISEVRLPPSIAPPSATPDPEGIETFGHYKGWAYYCGGGSSVLLACFHRKDRFLLSGPTFVDGTVELLVSRLSVSSIVGAQGLAVDGYDDGEFLDGTVGGTELFRYGQVAATTFDDPDWRVVSLCEDGSTLFVVYAPYPGSTYHVLCLNDSGELLGSDTFTGRSIVGYAVDDMQENSAVYCPDDGKFFFAHPIGSGSEEFRICRRSSVSAAIEAYVDIDFAAAGKEFSGIAPRPAGSPGVRVFRSTGTGLPCDYRDYDADMAALTAWVTMDFGPDYEMPGGRNAFVKSASGYHVFGRNPLNEPSVFEIDNSGDFDASLVDDIDQGPPSYPAASGSMVLQGPVTISEITLYRMLSDGSIA